MNPLFTWILAFTFSVAANATERVRHISVANDQIITVKTAIGIATIIQVPDRPNSIVVGDQESFKVVLEQPGAGSSGVPRPVPPLHTLPELPPGSGRWRLGCRRLRSWAGLGGQWSLRSGPRPRAACRK